MSRRKAKTDRELLADLTDRTKLFCDSWYDPAIKGCNKCPLVTLGFTDCREAYIRYLLNKGEVE